MNKKLLHFGITVGLLAVGVLYVAKKTGFLDDDSHLYDEFESDEV